jgi:hypothetical protein
VWGVGRREASSELRHLDGHIEQSDLLSKGCTPAALSMRIYYRHFKFRKHPNETELLQYMK